MNELLKHLSKAVQVSNTAMLSSEKKLSNKYVIIEKKISDIFNVEIVVGFMFTLLMKQFHSYGITPVNKFGAVFE